MSTEAPAPLTEGEIAELRQKHGACPECGPTGHCLGCDPDGDESGDYPCPTIRALDELARLRAALSRISLGSGDKTPPGRALATQEMAALARQALGTPEPDDTYTLRRLADSMAKIDTLAAHPLPQPDARAELGTVGE